MSATLDLIRGRQVVVYATNKSGGALAIGDVVIFDTGNDTAVTTTTSANSTKPVGVVQEAIANNAQGRVAVQGYVSLVNVPSSQTRGQYLATHTVAKQATGAASRTTGSFGYLETGGTTPAAYLFGIPDGAVSGIADQGTFTYVDGIGAAAPGTPSSGNARLYVKTDGRFYSKNDAGTEFGPFDAAGGGTLYAFDETFPGSSLPAGWTFTGSGTCVVAAGAATVTSAAQSDRVMFAYTPPTNGIVVIRAHLLAVSGTGGMPSLVALDSSGNGQGTGPYNDGSWYGWRANATPYQYSASDNTVGSSPSLTDVWASLLIIDGNICGGGFSSDGASWTGVAFTSPTQHSITQVGICQLFNSANMVVSISELTITEP